MTRSQLFIIRGVDGHPEAIHERIDRGPKDKTFVWWTLGPDREPVKSLQGRKVESLPLYGSQHVGGWDTSRPVYLVEGEKAMLALARAGHRALATLGSVPPGPGSLAVLIGLPVVLWPDADKAGRRVMQSIAACIEIGVLSLRWVDWPDAPAGGDAADYIDAGLDLAELELGAVPAPEPAEIIPIRPRRPKAARLRFTDQPIERFNTAVTVTDVLSRDFALQAKPGRAVRCPFHDDKHPSLKIYPDDHRVLCFVGDCWANNAGRGRDAWDLAHAAIGSVAR